MSSATGPNKDQSKQSASTGTDDGLDFEVSEAHGGQQELAGGYAPTGEAESKTDREPMKPPKHRAIAVALDDDEPIVESLVGSTVADEVSITSKTASMKIVKNDSATQSSQTSPAKDRAVPKLTEAQLKAVEDSMHQTREYLDEKEQRELLRRIQSPSELVSTPSQSSVVAPQKSHAVSPSHSQHSVVPFDDEAGARPKMTERSRGVAYFFQNVIQLNGQQELHEQEVLTVGDRQYTLRKRRFSRQTMAIAFGVVMGLALLVVGIMFMAGTGNGNGWVVGMVLNESDQPYIAGATIRFPDLHLTITSNGEGFFKSDAVPSGSHKVEYIVAGAVVGEDFVTVVDKQITNLVLRPAPVTTQSNPNPDESQSQPEEQARPVQNTITTGRVSLDAGVPGAKLILNGKTVGAGNLTFANITPGDYSYQIVKNGYQTAEGIVSVQAGQTTRIKMKLEAEPKEEVVQKPSAPVRTAYDEGLSALSSGDFANARTLFGQAIADGISVPSAYMGRAQGYAGEGANNEAISDYQSAAVAFAKNNQTRDAISAYSAILELDGRNVNALVGRGELFQSENEARAAAADFEAVTQIDRRNVAGLIGLGDARLTMGDPSRAQKHYKEARSIAPNDPGIYERLMTAYMATNDFKEVRKSWESYNKIAPAERIDAFVKDPANTALARVVGSGG